MFTGNLRIFNVRKLGFVTSNFAAVFDTGSLFGRLGTLGDDRHRLLDARIEPGVLYKRQCKQQTLEMK